MKLIADASPISNPALGKELNAIPDGVSFLQKFIPRAIGLAFVVGALVFFFIMIIGAIQWIASGGDKTALEGARGKITSAVVGLIILLSVFAILKVIQNFFHINILSIDIGPLVIIK